MRRRVLVTDGTSHGGKWARAQELGTRTEHPDDFARLLEHLQPARPRPNSKRPGPDELKPLQQIQTTLKHPAAGQVANLAAPSPVTIRTWARANGLPVGTRGRLQQTVLDAYTAAHTRSGDTA